VFTTSIGRASLHCPLSYDSCAVTLSNVYSADCVHNKDLSDFTTSIARAITPPKPDNMFYLYLFIIPPI